MAKEDFQVNPSEPIDNQSGIIDNTTPTEMLPEEKLMALQQTLIQYGKKYPSWRRGQYGAHPGVFIVWKDRYGRTHEAFYPGAVSVTDLSQKHGVLTGIVNYGNGAWTIVGGAE